MRSFLSNIPIDNLELYRPLLKRIAKTQGKRMRIRYRGPRYDAMRQTTLKKDARAFSVYFD